MTVDATTLEKTKPAMHAKTKGKVMDLTLKFGKKASRHLRHSFLLPLLRLTLKP